jgi:hypothetical protein
MRGVARELRDLVDWTPPSALRKLGDQLEEALADPERAVELGMCIGSECIRIHGLRVATWKGTGPCSIYVVCDECHAQRLTAEERDHMVELFGAAWVRHLGLHEMHNGRRPSAER